MPAKLHLPTSTSLTLNPRRPQQRLHKPIRPAETLRPSILTLLPLHCQRKRRSLPLASLFLKSHQFTRTKVGSCPTADIALCRRIHGIVKRVRNPFAGIDGNALGVWGREGGRQGEGEVCVGGPADEEVLQVVGVAGEAEGEFVGCEVEGEGCYYEFEVRGVGVGVGDVGLVFGGGGGGGGGGESGVWDGEGEG